RAARLGSLPGADLHRLSTSLGPQAPSQLVGRVPELVVLTRHLAGEGPPLLVLVGEPGIGKSRLRQEAAILALAGGWRVVEGSCSRKGGQQAYTPFASMVAQLLDALPDIQRRACLARDPWLAWLLPELLPELPAPRAPADVERAFSAEQERRL